MQILMFSVYDSKAEAYMKPFYSLTNGVAIRMMQEAISDKTHDFCKYPGDYTLFQIGIFDDFTGIILPNEAGHKNLGTALQIKTNQENEE